MGNRKLSARPCHHSQAEALFRILKTSRPSGDRAREKKVEPGAIEIWFADEALIGQTNKITCAAPDAFGVRRRAVTTEIPHK